MTALVFLDTETLGLDITDPMKPACPHCHTTHQTGARP